jgi:hypothetical protein
MYNYITHYFVRKYHGKAAVYRCTSQGDKN